jgi:hypothetical protein
MIADIDFRWVKRQVEIKTTSPTNDVIYAQEKMLQFRTHKIFGNSPMFISDWQDVPVVEE